MVKHYTSPVKVYKHKFETVMKAYERRFPKCDKIPLFCGSEIMDKADDGIEQKIIRKCFFNIDVPYLLKKIMNLDLFVFIQTNVLNRILKTLTIETVNESFSSRITINEHCKYNIHPDNQEWTCFQQMGSLDVKSFFGFENIAEKIIMKHYAASIEKGRELLEFFIEEVKKGDKLLSIPNSKDCKTFLPSLVDQKPEKKVSIIDCPSLKYDLLKPDIETDKRVDEIED